MSADTTYTLLPDPDARYRIAGYDGIAWHYLGDETAPDEDTEWSGYETPTGRVTMVMVGDDRRHSIDPSDCTALLDGDYCPSCGQIGCKAYAEG